jgi:predicted NACHT family NTPase
VRRPVPHGGRVPHPAGSKYGEILFIDGLDERRGGRGDRDTVDALATKLIEADPAAVRISCRVADWLGKSDLVSLEPFFEGREGMVVLALAALTPGERRAVLIENGMSQTEADALLREAEERALADFLDNPQNLLLLRRAVQSGAWPTTRRDLFEMATRLMLKEENSERARTGSGIYTGEELRLPAGAVLAARLIGDIEAISLADQEATETIPSYRTLPFFEPGKTIAVLGRRVFAAGPVPETVDYVHRTTAEYLGAAWLAQTVRAGLPIGRVVALMGVDGHPAPELRGLHAWLAVHLPEHAERLIDADPYGVLTYGDAASLSQTLCVRLLRALGRLSRTDPWFRTGNYGSPTIASLARADMVDEFRAVLRSPDAGSGVRGIIIEAAALGPCRRCETTSRESSKREPCHMRSDCTRSWLCFAWAMTAKPASCMRAAPCLVQTWPRSGCGRKQSDAFTAIRSDRRM